MFPHSVNRMRNFLESLVGTTDFMPHGYCLVWDPGLLVLHVGSDITTGLSYYLIAAALLYLVIKRRDLPYYWMFHLFGAFIFACGTTHFMAAWTIYVPSYWTEGIVKTATATLSLATAALFVPRLPRLLALPNLTRALEDNRRLNQELHNQITSLKEEIEKREKAETMLISIMDSVPDIFFFKDAHGVYLGCNKEFSLFSGRSKKEIIGKTDSDLFPGEQAELLQERDRQLLTTLMPQRTEEWMEYPNGRRVLLDTLKTPFFGPDHDLLGLIGISRDITERTRAEEALQKSEKRLRAVFDASHDAIITIDRESTILSLNNGAEKMFGYAPGELVGEPLRRLMPDRYKERHLMGVRRFIETGVSQYCGKVLEFEGVRKDGSEFSLELNISSWRSDGEPYFSGVLRDISERKAMETERKSAYERFKTLVNSLDALVYVADMKTYELLFVNEYGQKIWGDITGKICWQTLQSGQEGPCLFCTNDKLLTADGQPAGVHVWEFQNTVDGEWYECRDQAIEWTDGRYVRMEIATNITSRKNAELEKYKLENHLRQVQKMEAIGTLAGGIAHDFNNILVPIIAYTDILMRDARQGSPTREALAEIYSAATRARELVKQILTFSREREQELNSVLITPVIRESLKLIKASLPSTIIIKQDLQTDHAMVLGDPTQLHQVVMNLCTNAYHAMREQGGILGVSLRTVTVGMDDPGNDFLDPGPYLQLTVSDTGPGMTRTTMERIFEPYFTTKRQGEGTGLGLAVVHGIVKNHKGKIKVYSEPGQGTAFHVYLPLLGGTAVADSGPAPPPLVIGHEHILLVDDEAKVVEPTQKILEQHGYRVTGTTSSVEALELFRANPANFDLVITDQTMPYMTGDHLALEIKRLRTDIPIILCTGFSSTINETKAEALGIKAFLMKPMLRAELTETVRRVLDAR